MDKSILSLLVSADEAAGLLRIARTNLERLRINGEVGAVKGSGGFQYSLPSLEKYARAMAAKSHISVDKWDKVSSSIARVIALNRGD